MTTISSASVQYVKVRISATESGEAVDPTSATVTMAFVSVGAEPSSGDWKTASWETDTARSRFYARCLVGTGGAVTLTDGTYQPRIKIAGISPETPVLPADGTLIVT